MNLKLDFSLAIDQGKAHPSARRSLWSTARAPLHCSFCRGLVVLFGTIKEPHASLPPSKPTERFGVTRFRPKQKEPNQRLFFVPVDQRKQRDKTFATRKAKFILLFIASSYLQSAQSSTSLQVLVFRTSRSLSSTFYRILNISLWK